VNAETDGADHPIVRWLIEHGRAFSDQRDFLAALGERLRAADTDVTRLTTGIPILHPQVSSSSCLWERGKPVTERLYHSAPENFAILQNSPIGIVYDGGGPVRCDLEAPPRDDDFPIMVDLRAAGLSDYVVMPARFSDGTTKAVSLATDRSGGFTAGELALFEAMMPALAMVLEIQTLRRTARTLLETYVGRESGARVLDGAIRRGSVDTIRAVVWLCDLRGFSRLSEALPGEALIALLNDYFGALSEAVEAHGGEVLKFIGDAMLAIFPLEESHDIAEVCGRALAAAAEAGATVAGLNTSRETDGAPRIDYGLALHVGEVLYGNIGGATRLDFTVIGPAVNLAARLEALTALLDRPLLLSAAFAEACGLEVEALGAHELKGIDGRHEVFAPR
jgi:adenylate cyclase